MEKKRSVGVTILAWLYILIGLVGSSVFIETFSRFFTGKLGSGFGAVFTMTIMILYLPFLLIFISGIYILKLKFWAILVNIFASLIIVLFNLLLLYYKYNLLWWTGMFKIIGGVVFLLMLFSIWFFTRPEIKEQFK